MCRLALASTVDTNPSQRHGAGVWRRVAAHLAANIHCQGLPGPKHGQAARCGQVGKETHGTVRNGKGGAQAGRACCHARHGQRWRGCWKRPGGRSVESCDGGVGCFCKVAHGKQGEKKGGDAKV
ncbi:hypothetical protein BCR44DRAFT_1433594 [Catenaria anguillulae PL171]|uniref:Uncharacterized protein n=1 Tax=Catenaria anguillulae PL171 TaxID=765915 RepID=A0A1Y2HML9_9FUNG|nr:hypothetical protein BCR44DRAFT_1433594 [Catenaria anguillulae PL171]